MRILLLVLVLTAVGCASTGSTTRRNMDELTLDEIQASNQVNAYDLVRTLRPQWLRTRGSNSILSENPIMVYVDGTRLGGPRELTNIPRLSIEHIEYFSPPEAQARWGLNHTNGAIAVTTRRG